MRNTIRKFALAISFMLVVILPALGQQNVVEEKDYVAYLFTYFQGNHISEEAVCYAVSMDGYNYWALNGNKPVIDSKVISSTGGVRDPHILRCQDGKTFYMVLTDMVSANGWDSNRAMVLLKSTDLVNWSHSVINMQKRYDGQEKLKRVWAPQTIYDPEAGKYMVYWSMKYGDGADVIYYAYANTEFTDLEGEPKPLFVPENRKSCIDGDIVYKDGIYHLFYKTEGNGNGIKVATTRSLTSGKWSEEPDYKQQTKEAVEGAGTFKLINQDKYILMYDVYMKGGYQFTETTDLKNFKAIDSEVKMNFHPRHGTIIPITRDELVRITDKWGKPAELGVLPNNLAVLPLVAQHVTVSGPDGKLLLTVTCPDGGEATYSITYNGKQMLESSPLGLQTNVGDFAKAMKMTGHQERKLDSVYEQTRIKASRVHYLANELVCNFVNEKGQKVDVTFRVSNNDVAFRYTLPKQGERGSVTVNSEKTGFRFPSKTTTFLTPQSDAMIGWKRTKPSYEEEYKADAPMDVRSQYGHGYTFPCLYHVGEDGWVLVSETGVSSRYCASRLSDATEGNLYTLTFPMPEENNGNGTIAPAFALPGSTPWRTITVGETLKPIVETTVMWDVVEPLYETEHDYRMGRGTWSWILWQDGSINYDDQVRYVDLAAAMGYEYVLIDNWWNTNIGHERMATLIDYAQSKGVDVFLWYSSSGYWNDIEQGPTNLMDNPIARKREMKWMQKLGVKGIKVDFFGGDKQETIRLYEAILSDADDHGLMVIFHGCTVPRGWERMYPNYVGSEAVLASENLIFNQHFCDEEAFNACLHPFIRNTIGCMEFGGTFLNKRLNRGNNGGTTRRTTDVFQLATAVLFQNPIQNYALAPNNLMDAPQVCLDFMKKVPTTWDEIRFIDGYPGKYVVIARRHDQQWYVVAVNGTKEVLKLKLELPMLAGQTVDSYSDDKQFQPQLKNMKLKADGKLQLTLQPEGGAVLVTSSNVH